MVVPIQGRTQFLIDAVDRANSGESEAIINRFPTDLELTPGPCFTDRRTYTGIYSVPGLGFDMSFRVQCSENYYGTDCNTFCEPVEGGHICDNEGRVICLQKYQDPATRCMTCLQGLVLETNCATCSALVTCLIVLQEETRTLAVLHVSLDMIHQPTVHNAFVVFNVK